MGYLLELPGTTDGNLYNKSMSKYLRGLRENSIVSNKYEIVRVGNLCFDVKAIAQI